MNEKEYKLWRLYDKGKERLEKELDMVKILRNIRYLRIYRNI